MLIKIAHVEEKLKDDRSIFKELSAAERELLLPRNKESVRDKNSTEGMSNHSNGRSSSLLFINPLPGLELFAGLTPRVNSIAEEVEKSILSINSFDVEENFGPADILPLISCDGPRYCGS